MRQRRVKPPIDGYDVIGNPVPKLNFDTPPPEPRPNADGGFDYPAPRPLPADWKPGFEQPTVTVEVVRAQLEPLKDLNIGAQEPYPSKEDITNGTALPLPDNGSDADAGEP